MNDKPSRNDIVNEYLLNLSNEVAPLFLEIRACILDAAPDLNESIKWKDCLVYGTTKNHIQTVVGKDKISLIFFDGVSLKDEYGLLEGEGKKARTMRIRAMEFNRDALRDYVQQTVS